MHFGLWFRYLIGEGRAIRELAENRATLWTGAGLVLLTSIARNYDQTFIAEKPFLWLFGSLLFSLVSGTWLYALLYGWFVRRAAADADGNKPEFWSRWRCFMGLFWMTAPIAWLYAIPVERFLDSLAAAKANLTLLGIVSLWRVVLITRVVQCLTGARFYAVLLWVLFAAAMETLVVFFFGGAFAKALMAGMGGMRNSPEEALMVSALGAVFVGAFWSAPAFFIAALIVGSYQSADDISSPIKSHSAGRALLIAAVAWGVVAVVPRIELSRNFRFEKMVSAKNYRGALDYLSAQRATDFAPARVLAPNAFERGIFTELPGCFEVVKTNDPIWLREHLVRRLDEMLSHYAWGRNRTLDSYSPEEQKNQIVRGLSWYGPDAQAMAQLLDGLGRIPEGQEWLKSNPAFLEGVKAACVANTSKSSGTNSEASAAWLALDAKLSAMGVTDTAITNAPGK